MNSIKKIALLLILTVSVSSCFPEDDGPNYHLELLKIESVNMPDTLILGQTHELKMLYNKPSNCHTFNGFYFEKNLNIRTIAVQSIATEKSDCITLNDELEEATLNFYVTNNGSYIFKFWKGKDTNGEDIFLEIEVPVKE